MAHLGSHTSNIHHGPESAATSLLFDADKSSQIEPVSEVKKTKLCIKEPLEEKSPGKRMHVPRNASPADTGPSKAERLKGIVGDVLVLFLQIFFCPGAAWRASDRQVQSVH